MQSRAAAFCCLMMTTGSALAQSAKPTAVLVGVATSFSEEAWPEAELRVKVELSISGFEVVVVPGSAGDEGARRMELFTAAEQHDAVVAVRVLRAAHDAGIEIWLEDRLTGKTTVRRIPATDVRGSNAAAVVAIKMAELLRASFLEIKASHAARVEAPAVVETLVRESLEESNSPSRSPLADLSVHFGAGAVGRHLGRVGMLPATRLGVSWQLFPRWSLHGSLSSSLSAKTVSNNVGAVRIGLASGRLAATFDPLPGAVISPHVGIALSGLLVRSEGQPGEGLIARNQKSLVAAPGPYFSLTVPLLSSVSLHTEVSAAWTLPEVEVRIADQKPVRLGRPLLEASLGLAVALP